MKGTCLIDKQCFTFNICHFSFFYNFNQLRPKFLNNVLKINYDDIG